MADFQRKIEAEIENIEMVLFHLEEAIERPEKTVIELSAMATFLHNAYNGIENILKQVLKNQNIKIKKTDRWHKDVLARCVEMKIISVELEDDLYEYLTFRHFFIHSYGFLLQEAPIIELAEKLPTVWLQFKNEIKRLL